MSAEHFGIAVFLQEKWKNIYFAKWQDIKINLFKVFFLPEPTMYHRPTIHLI